jgi:hypothetical protein
MGNPLCLLNCIASDRVTAACRTDKPTLDRDRREQTLQLCADATADELTLGRQRNVSVEALRRQKRTLQARAHPPSTNLIIAPSPFARAGRLLGGSR